MKRAGILLNIFWGGLVIAMPMLSFISDQPSAKAFYPEKKFQFEKGWAEKQLAQMTLEEKIGQFFMIAAYSGQGVTHLNEVSAIIEKNRVGGVIFFKGERADLKQAIARFQSESKVPLLVGMDAEWGVQMRLMNEDRFPYAYTIGAADSVELTEKIAAMMANECRELGIHINFAPVADVNSNPKNPVIGFRSFGENPVKVGRQVRAFVKGMEGAGVMTSVKHFPGHGNTDIDSHLDLPTITESLISIEAIDLPPFTEGFAAGSSSVMIGHLNVPALDDSGTPASLSRKVIHDYLQGKLNYEGLVISDALNMKAVADRYGKSEVAVKAFEAGCDILLFPEDVGAAIVAIRNKVENGSISIAEIDARCLKILKAKEQFLPEKSGVKSYSAAEVDIAKSQVYERAIAVLKNKDSILPLARLDRSIARVSIGGSSAQFKEAIELFVNADDYHFETVEEARAGMSKIVHKYDVIITGLHSSTVRLKDNFGFGEEINHVLKMTDPSKDNILVLFGNPLALKGMDVSHFKGVIAAYENHGRCQNRVAQLIFGAIPALGKLPFTISKDHPRESGITYPWSGRLKYTAPEEFGISAKKLDEIDSIAVNGIRKGAYPGCQIVIALHGKIIYRKSFGTHEYKGDVAVKHTDLYDIASVSKIAGSTIGVMKLASEGKFSLSKTLNDYLPELVIGKYKNINIREMMAHQAGLPAWIAFYKKTFTDGKYNERIYSTTKKPGFETKVAENVYILDSYADSIYQQIMEAPLGEKTYVYSDLGYYFIKKIVEKQSSMAFDSFLYEQMYKPMGLRSIRFNPLNYFSSNQIVPTENDQTYRKQLLRGYVHDPGAAMLGGVAGHAGVFSNATDLASLMQMIMNNGVYGNYRYLSEDVVKEFTRAQFSGNRRGAGFDRPKASGGGTCYETATQSSYGHSGFTGTLVWADPERGINYVFLSNRVCPDQENWKLRDMNIRTEIQRVIYEALAGK